MSTTRGGTGTGLELGRALAPGRAVLAAAGRMQQRVILTQGLVVLTLVPWTMLIFSAALLLLLEVKVMSLELLGEHYDLSIGGP